MTKTYNYELSVDSLEKLSKKLEEIEKSLSYDGLNKFLMDKCKARLEEILKETNVEGDQRASEYLAGNKTEIGKNYIELFNDSEIDIPSADTFFSEEWKKNYPEKLSLAELIEYGAGLVGYQSSRKTGDEWEYMANYGRDYEKGWKWRNVSYPSFPSPTKGQEGRYIYYQLYQYVKDHADEWLEEYFNAILGS